MDEQILIFSQNCQGLSLAAKRRDMFHFVRLYYLYKFKICEFTFKMENG